MKSELTKDLIEFYNKRLKSSDNILERLIFIGSLFTTLFFLFIYLNYVMFHLDSVVVGFFHELLIIPALLSQPIFLFLTFYRFYEKKYVAKLYGYLSVVILFTSQILIWRSLLSNN